MADRRFHGDRFVELALSGLEDLELKQRVDHVASALEQAMPEDFKDAAAVIESAADSHDFDGWMVYPVNAFIGRAGIDEPHVALPLLARTTGRWTAEFAIRPFIEQHFEVTYTYLRRWVDDPDHHVRRLVSEGTRPRLPWGTRLRELQADPRPSIELLDRLIDDSSEYVRRSVANHLNDVTKDHPELALETATRWLGPRRSVPPSHRLAIVRHGLRTLIKQGDPKALILLGFDPAAAISVTHFGASPGELEIGGQATLALELAGARTPAPAMIDYLIHYQGANGPRAPKVFKWTVRTVDAAPLSLRRRHRFQHASIRRLHPGPHLIEVQINGRIRAATTIDLSV